MRNTAKYRSAIALLSLFLLNGCAASIGAATPFTAALSSCSIAPVADRMVPDNLVLLSSGLKYRINDVSVLGPTKRTIAPPILAATFAKALKRSLQQTGLLDVDARQSDQVYRLAANIISQTRHGTFTTTTLELVVSYSLISQQNVNNILWSGTITTSGKLQDWKSDACMRLRKLQERVSKQNLQELIRKLSQIN